MAAIDNNPAHLFPAFATKIEDLLSDMNAWCAVHFPGHTAVIAEGYRSTARQVELFNQGRFGNPGDIVTQKNGTTNKSRHQHCLAVDIVPSGPNGEFWPDDSHPFWSYLQHCAHVQALTSGSDWVGFKDHPHVEWPSVDGATYLAAVAWKKQRGLL